MVMTKTTDSASNAVVTRNTITKWFIAAKMNGMDSV